MKPQVPEGLTVQYNHSRYYNADGLVQPRGGSTTARIFKDVPTEDAEEFTTVVVAHGHAYCNESDNYNKRIGRNIALGRALKRLR
jgi:hypothetical protein